ncbi:unnamed protein product [Prorocentrum cordatum]|uniref:non-specific serine/threonine protein kinase n=1 Tax=Prorocentrum cordatum TaxID=2364126 RepID=A0ABN9WAL9_9DINO|nr:unnamed protein product [Polarella glacialis]
MAAAVSAAAPREGAAPPASGAAAAGAGAAPPAAGPLARRAESEAAPAATDCASPSHSVFSAGGRGALPSASCTLRTALGGEGRAGADGEQYEETRSERPRPAQELDAAGAELDRVLGVSGSVCALRERARPSGPRAAAEGRTAVGDARLLTLEGFMESFWELLWGVQREFCQAIARKPARRREDPRDVYDFERTLGSGTYGEVRLARDKATGARRAIKRVGRQFCGASDKLDEELEHLRVLDHPNIVKLYEHYEDNDHIYIVMDYCCGGELQTAVTKSREARQGLPEEFVSDVMQQT